MKKLFMLLLSLCLAIAPAASQAAEVKPLKVGEVQPFKEDESLVKVYFFKVRAQDSFLVVAGGETMLIDCGVYTSGPVVAGYLKHLGIDHIDYAVNTHPHDDHIDGFKSLMDEITIGKFYVCFPFDVNAEMRNAVATARKHDIPVERLTDDMDISFGGVTIRLYQDKHTNDINHQSMIMHLSYGECAVLLLADTGRGVHERITEAWGEGLKCDILKLPHHGIYRPRKIMVTTADPEVCILTNGNNKSSDETIRYVKSWKYPILHTTHGNIECTTNGEYGR